MTKLYLAGPMRGIPEFNFPAFQSAAALLRRQGFEVFSPAERDIERHGGKNISAGNANGDEAVAIKEHGFNLRDALADDTAYICKQADGIALLPGWRGSKGAVAEHALAVALGLLVLYV